jgi:hypothetical protein
MVDLVIKRATEDDLEAMKTRSGRQAGEGQRPRILPRVQKPSAYRLEILKE